MSDDTKTSGPTKAKASTQSKRPDARRQLAEMKAKEEERVLEKRMEDFAGQDWFVRCRHCHGVALFLTEYPIGGTVKSDMWYSDYRDLDTKYISDKIPCQECTIPLTVTFPHGIRGSWNIKTRWIQSIEDMKKRKKVADAQRSEAKAMQVAKVSIMEGEQ